MLFNVFVFTGGCNFSDYRLMQFQFDSYRVDGASECVEISNRLIRCRNEDGLSVTFRVMNGSTCNLVSHIRPILNDSNALIQLVTATKTVKKCHRAKQKRHRLPKQKCDSSSISEFALFNARTEEDASWLYILIPAVLLFSICNIVMILCCCFCRVFRLVSWCCTLLYSQYYYPNVLYQQRGNQPKNICSYIDRNFF